jgi:hypothetical protein
MQWDKNLFPRHYNKNMDSLTAFYLLLPKKPCISRRIRKECIKGTETLTRVRHFKTGTLKTKCGGYSNKSKDSGRQILHYLFLEIRSWVLKSISDTPCPSMCCCIVCGSHCLTGNPTKQTVCIYFFLILCLCMTHTQTNYRCVVVYVNGLRIYDFLRPRPSSWKNNSGNFGTKGFWPTNGAQINHKTKSVIPREF